MHLFKIAVVVGLLSVGCGGGSSVKDPNTAPPPSKPLGDVGQSGKTTGARGLVPAQGGASPVQLAVYSVKAGVRRVLSEGDSLRSGDRVGFEVTSAEPTHVYLIQRFSDGKIAVLFPKVGESNRIQGRTKIPSGDLFQLDEVTGKEIVYLVASSKPLQSVASDVKAAIDDVRTGRDMVAGVGNPQTKAQPQRKTRSLSTTRKRKRKSLLDLETRGLVRVRASGGVDIRPDKTGLAIYRFSFNHLPRR